MESHSYTQSLLWPHSLLHVNFAHPAVIKERKEGQEGYYHPPSGNSILSHNTPGVSEIEPVDSLPWP
ncbi:hypothetical protein MHYP_G00303530 [Metynnis hypsauchen]